MQHPPGAWHTAHAQYSGVWWSERVCTGTISPFPLGELYKHLCLRALGVAQWINMDECLWKDGLEAPSGSQFLAQLHTCVLKRLHFFSTDGHLLMPPTWGVHLSKQRASTKKNDMQTGHGGSETSVLAAGCAGCGEILDFGADQEMEACLRGQLGWAGPGLVGLAPAAIPQRGETLSRQGSDQVSS